jgi:molybdopterin/thiamine biosynthesis adenylyltransferase
MNDQQLRRYSRQILLPEIGYEGQQALLAAHVLIIGLGGLGSPAALYLAAAGIGSMTLIDDDQVDLSNLQRQIIHDLAGVGDAKTHSAAARIAALNPDVRVTALDERFGEGHRALVEQADLVLDCCDNFASRDLIGRLCHDTGTPLVSAAAIRFEGQLSLFPSAPGAPCYRCLYPAIADQEQSCSETGILAPLVGVMGCLQAVEAIKWITRSGDPLVGKLLLYDGLHGSFRTLRLHPDPACPVCGEAPAD